MYKFRNMGHKLNNYLKITIRKEKQNRLFQNQYQ